MSYITHKEPELAREVKRVDPSMSGTEFRLYFQMLHGEEFTIQVYAHRVGGSAETGFTAQIDGEKIEARGLHSPAAAFNAAVWEINSRYNELLPV